MEVNESGLQPSSLGHQEWGTLPYAEELPAISGVPGPSTQSLAAEIPTVPPTNGIINGQVMYDWTTKIPSQSSSSAYYPTQTDNLFPAPGDYGLVGESPLTTFGDIAEQPNHIRQSTALGNSTLQNVAYDVNNSSSINRVPGEAPTSPATPVTPINPLGPAPVTDRLPNNIQAQIMASEVESMRMILRAEEEELQQRTLLLQGILRAQEQARAQRAQMIRAWGAAIDKRPRMD